SCGYSPNDIMNGCTFLDGLGTEVCCLAENATTWFSTQNAPNYGCCANLHRQWDTDDYYCKTGSCITVEGASCTFHTSDDNCCYPFLCDSGSNTCELAPPTN
ncbi:MAG: hypothetical protein ACKOCK_03255, partial [Chloroflexota bacterium]